MNTTLDLYTLVEQLGRACEAHGVMLATAESCTGGGIASAITDVAGSSGWFDRAFVTYSNEAKMEMLGVSAATLNVHGAVSEDAAREMAAGAIARSRAGLAVAVTGIAGPSGGTVEKPVGLVWFAWARRGGDIDVERRQFSGDRASVRQQTQKVALEGLLARCNAAP
jgi:nicotinamide-nucleotide amidase